MYLQTVPMSKWLTVWCIWMQCNRTAIHKHGDRTDSVNIISQKCWAEIRLTFSHTDLCQNLQML